VPNILPTPRFARACTANQAPMADCRLTPLGGARPADLFARVRLAAI
jgi:hypothetical protein